MLHPKQFHLPNSTFIRWVFQSTLNSSLNCVTCVHAVVLSYLCLCCTPWLQVLEQADQDPQGYRSQKQAKPTDIQLRSCNSRTSMLEGAIGEFKLVSALKIISQTDTISDLSNFYFIQVLCVIFLKGLLFSNILKVSPWILLPILHVLHHVLDAHDMLLMQGSLIQ